MRKRCSLILAVMLLAAVAFAQDTAARFHAKSTITVTADGLNCTTALGTPGAFPVLSWSFSATNPASIGSGTSGAGAGKVNFAPFTITKLIDACSPKLFQTLAAGHHFNKVTIVQQDANKDDVTTIVLKEVFITSYQLSGDQANEFPVENISFVYAAVEIADAISGTKAGWNLQANKPF